MLFFQLFQPFMAISRLGFGLEVKTLLWSYKQLSSDKLYLTWVSDTFFLDAKASIDTSISFKGISMIFMKVLKAFQEYVLCVWRV